MDDKEERPNNDTKKGEKQVGQKPFRATLRIFRNFFDSNLTNMTIQKKEKNYVGVPISGFCSPFSERRDAYGKRGGRKEKLVDSEAGKWYWTLGIVGGTRSPDRSSTRKKS